MTEINVDLEESQEEKQVLTPEEMAGIERAQKLGAEANEASAFRVPTELVPLPSFGLVYPPNSPLHNIKEIDYVVIDRPLNNICIQYKNGNFYGSKITNFERRDLKKLEKLEKTDLDLEIEEMKG